MNAIDLLEQQHEEVMEMLGELEESEAGAERNATFKKLKQSLLAHMVIEEEIFYPMVVNRTQDGEPIAEGYEEHSGARTALARCATALKRDELFQVRIGVLKEMIKHHVDEEREAILPKAKETVDAAELEAIGQEMEARFMKAVRSSTANSELNSKSTARELRALDA